MDVRANTRGWARFQDLITPLWKRIGGGCHPNRDTVTAIVHAGFKIQEFEYYDIGLPHLRPVARGVGICP
jgi:hypothetical protein